MRFEHKHQLVHGQKPNELNLQGTLVTHGAQIIPKLGRILKFKPQQCYKLIKTLLQTENEGWLGFELWPRFARFFCAFALKS